METEDESRGDGSPAQRRQRHRYYFENDSQFKLTVREVGEAALLRT